MQTTTTTERSLALSYLGLRRGLGLIGIALPFVLAIGKILVDGPGLLDNISAYYYSGMRNVLVGSLCAMGVFLISYRYTRQDDIAGNLAGISAIGMALFPTALPHATQEQLLIGLIHEVLSAVFFFILAFFALVLFRETDRDEKPTWRKHLRNSIYLLCGSSILVCLALLALLDFLPVMAWLPLPQPAFWLESLATVAFGVAWFIKGETILKDG